MRNQPGFSWFMLFIVFSVASGVLGMFSVPLGALIGLPLAWTSVLTMPLALLAVWLVYRGYPARTWLLVGALAFILISALAIINGLTASKPSNPTSIPDELLDRDEEFLYSFDEQILAEYDRDSFLIYEYQYRPRTRMTIVFPPIESLGGAWAFQSGSVQGAGDASFKVLADPDDNWFSPDQIEFPTAGQLRSANPELVATIPLQRSSEQVELIATISIVYPDSDGELAEQTLSRTLTLYRAPNDYDFYTYQENYDNWKRARDFVENPLLLGSAIGGSILAAIGAGVLLMRGGLQPGALSVQVRRLSGLQLLGIEAYPLTQISSATGDQGVFVGLVNAQSPAGRAGLRSGDVLVTFAGAAINSPQQLNRLAGRAKRGEVAQVQILRDGEALDLFIKF